VLPRHLKIAPNITKSSRWICQLFCWKWWISPLEHS